MFQPLDNLRKLHNLCVMHLRWGHNEKWPMTIKHKSHYFFAPVRLSSDLNFRWYSTSHITVIFLYKYHKSHLLSFCLAMCDGFRRLRRTCLRSLSVLWSLWPCHWQTSRRRLCLKWNTGSWKSFFSQTYKTSDRSTKQCARNEKKACNTLEDFFCDRQHTTNAWIIILAIQRSTHLIPTTCNVRQ